MQDFEETVFVYDGSLEGLLSAVFTAYYERVVPSDIVRGNKLQPRLGHTIREIETSVEHALRVQKGICLRCGPVTFEAIKSTSLSDNPDIGTIIYRFLRYALKKNKPMDCSKCSRKMSCGGLCTKEQQGGALSEVMHPAVAPLIKENRAVHNERHRWMQFLRFEHLEGDVWFARCNPNASILPLIMDWFVGRFNTQAFLIYDEVHHLAGVYEGADWYLVKTDSITLPARSEDDFIMQHAWKTFYHTIAVESRYNPELRRQFMPKRFWRNIVEMHESVSSPPKHLAQGTHPDTLISKQEFFASFSLPAQE
ncbi:MAG: TIGR03915 family putative DNA repair protein [Raoultibacter sp.]|jgi:hypothetical protein